MLKRARQHDPEGDYRLVRDGDLSQFEDGSFDLVLAAFTFDNIPAMEHKVALFTQLRRLLKPEGRIVNLVSSPDIYQHEWASFSTRDFPENRQARAGDTVRIIVTDHADRRPVEDVLWPHEAYLDVYRQAGLEIIQEDRPLATGREPYVWGEETRIAPWVIYVLKQKI
jgi:SAM-dependent methyltransferase